MTAKEITISLAFWRDDMVMHRASPLSGCGLITSFLIQGTQIMYGVSWRPGDQSFHYGHELELASAEAIDNPDGVAYDDDGEEESSP